MLLIQFDMACWCGNMYGRYGPASNCDMPCNGNSSQICGGSMANSVMQVTVPENYGKLEAFALH